MKKLMFAAVIAAMSAATFAADEAAKPAAEAAKPAAEAARPARPKFDRSKFEARMKERQAERKAKMVETLKKYGLDDEKASACADELLKPVRPERPARPPRQQAPTPAGD